MHRGWEQVITGSFVLYFSASCFCLTTAIPILTSLTKSRIPTAVNYILLFLTVAAAVLGAVGMSFCSGVPPPSRARGTVMAGTLFMIGTAASGTIVSFLIVVASTETRSYSSSAAGNLSFFLLLMMLLFVICLLASFVLFLYFLVIVAIHLQAWQLMGNTIALSVLAVISPLILMLVMTMTSPSAMMGGGLMGTSKLAADLLTLFSFGMVIGLTLWFCLTLGSLTKAIRRAAKRGTI
jgi:hypothetical protein